MRYALLVMLVVGCYEAPDYDGTRFKCDADHPCPPGQTCVNGTCNGSGNGSVDADSSAASVACGTMTCGAGEKCCATLINLPTCIALAATCAGISATCDGVEDCAGGVCCDGAAGSQQIACTATCTSTTICRENVDCPNSAPMCCMGLAGTNEPWGRCFAACP